MPSKVAEPYSFGPFRVDFRTGTLWKGEELLALTPKASELLLLLVREGETGLTKVELLERLWPDTVVLENNLTVAVSTLRKALGESASSPRYIQTLPRRGYRFVPSALDVAPDAAPVQVARRPGLSGSFVGRSAELEFLQRKLSAAQASQGRVVCLTGPPGIGKSYLAEHFLERAVDALPGLLCARGRSLEHFGPREAYLPFLEALGELLNGSQGERVQRALRSFAPTWCWQFPGVFAAEAKDAELRRETVGATRERMLREFVDVLSALAQKATLVLSIEDLHWGDPSSIDLLRLLCQRSHGRAWLILASFRSAEAMLHNVPLARFRKELTGREYDELALEPLAQEQVRSYLAARFRSGRFPDALCDVLYAKTEGHPLFLTRLVSLFVERGDISETPEGWALMRALSEMELSLPADVRGTLQRQLELLDPADLRALSYASVEGEEFSSAVSAALLEIDELSLEERLDELCRVHQLIELVASERAKDGRFSVRYRFAHSVYQNLLYEGLVERRRAQLHLRIAEVLLARLGEQASHSALQLALHFERGGDSARAVEFFTHAGQNAHKLLAHREARSHFTRALELLGPGGSSVQAARLHLARGWVDFDAGEGDRGEADFERSQEHARSAADLELECDALFAGSVAVMSDFRLEQSFRLDVKLFEVARASRNPECIARALVSLACGRACEARLEEALELNHQGFALLEPGFKPDIAAGLYANLGGCQLLRSEYQPALESFQSALAIWLDVSGVMSVDTCQTLGHIFGNLGRMSEALAAYARAAELARRNGQEVRHHQQPSGVGWILRELGAFQAAVAADQRAIDSAREAGARYGELSQLIDLAADQLAAGAPELSALALERARQLLGEGSLRAHPYDLHGAKLRLLAAESLGHRFRAEPDRARRSAEELLLMARLYDSAKYKATAHRLFAGVCRSENDLSEAEQQLGAALETLSARPVPILAWRILAELAELQLGRGALDLAHRSFGAARQIVSQIAGNIEQLDLRQSFLDSAEVRNVLAFSGELGDGS